MRTSLKHTDYEIRSFLQMIVLLGLVKEKKKAKNKVGKMVQWAAIKAAN